MPFCYAPGEAYHLDRSHAIILIQGVTTTVTVANVRPKSPATSSISAGNQDLEAISFDRIPWPEISGRLVVNPSASASTV